MCTFKSLRIWVIMTFQYNFKYISSHIDSKSNLNIAILNLALMQCSVDFDLSFESWTGVSMYFQLIIFDRKSCIWKILHMQVKDQLHSTRFNMWVPSLLNSSGMNSKPFWRGQIKGPRHVESSPSLSKTYSLRPLYSNF